METHAAFNIIERSDDDERRSGGNSIWNSWLAVPMGRHRLQCRQYPFLVQLSIFRQRPNLIYSSGLHVIVQSANRGLYTCSVWICARTPPCEYCGGINSITLCYTVDIYSKTLLFELFFAKIRSAAHRFFSLRSL